MVHYLRKSRNNAHWPIRCFLTATDKEHLLSEPIAKVIADNFNEEYYYFSNNFITSL